MTKIHHINCGTLQTAAYGQAICHCLLLEDAAGLALIDSGIGLLEVQSPAERLGQGLIDMAGFQFHEANTAVRNIERLGFVAGDVRHIVLTHADPDHAGGLADFPQAEVHISAEEHANVSRGHWRYVPLQFAHGPNWRLHSATSLDWFGLSARRVPLGFESEVLLIPTFGHTLGHCAVAIEQSGGWTLHVGDAYYLRGELAGDDHPISQLTKARADDDELRKASLAELRRLARDHAGEITMFGYHDAGEFPLV